MTITDLIPADAITVADTAEYAAWKSADGGTEVWIDMKERDTFVTERIMMDVLQTVIIDGFADRIQVAKVTVPDASKFHDALKSSKPRDPALESDFGTFTLIDLAEAA